MVFVCEKMDVVNEFYFAILMDRAHQGPVLMASSEGGMDIEGVARDTPEKIITEPIHVTKGLQKDQATRIARAIGVSAGALDNAVDSMFKLYEMFNEADCTLLEINPLAEAAGDRIICMDAKLNFDDNAEFRQSEIFGQRDWTQEDPREVQAAEFDLNYIGLDGSIGCLVNGAGLAMASLDIITLHGGSPANFLDVGGGATAQQVTEAFNIISKDPKVTCIMVNIFGGIMRCDVIAQGIIQAASTLKLTIPIIVRLEGTNRDEAKTLIAESGMDIISANDLDQAAQKAVKCSKIVELGRELGVGIKFQV
jgi:succinyl-CoA synthetase beta subunit